MGNIELNHLYKEDFCAFTHFSITYSLIYKCLLHLVPCRAYSYPVCPISPASPKEPASKPKAWQKPLMFAVSAPDGTFHRKGTNTIQRSCLPIDTLALLCRGASHPSPNQPQLSLCTPGGFRTHPEQPDVNTRSYRCKCTDRSRNTRRPQPHHWRPGFVLAE